MGKTVVIKIKIKNIIQQFQMKNNLPCGANAQGRGTAVKAAN